MRSRAWLAAALLGAAVCLSAAHARTKPRAPADTPEIAGRQADLKDLRERIEALRKEVAAGESHKAHASDRLRESEREISGLQRELHQLAGQRGQLQTSLNNLQKQSQELEAGLLQQQSQLEKLLRRQYMRGSPDALQLLLNGGDPNQLARDMVYLSLIGRARAELLGEIHATLDRKKTLAAQTRDEVEELAEVEAEQKQRHAELQKQRSQRQQVLAEVSSKLAGQRKEIGHLQQDEKRLTQLVDRLSKLLAARAKAAEKAAEKPVEKPGEKLATPEKPVKGREPVQAQPVEAENRYLPTPGNGLFAQQKGQLRLPVRGAVVGRYGAAREGGGSWKGVFIRAAEGSEVKAVAQGRVVFAEWMRGFGNLLIIDHGDAYLSIYGNNDSLLKQVGDAVKGGESVASVGNSGGNPETGLYFELRHQGQTLDPLKWASIK